MRQFYVCSYGGSGSKMLVKYLENFGKVFHIHSRFPPDKLTHSGGINNYIEWFNNNVIDEETMKNVTVIYIYRNPIDAILSRFTNPLHLFHIQVFKDKDIIEMKKITNDKNYNEKYKDYQNYKLSDITSEMKDLYGIDEFYNNYTTPNLNRNYKIYAINYDKFFDNIKEINKILNLPDNTKIYPVKSERTKKYDSEIIDKLNIVYKDLNDKMQKMNFIEII